MQRRYYGTAPSYHSKTDFGTNQVLNKFNTDRQETPSSMVISFNQNNIVKPIKPKLTYRKNIWLNGEANQFKVSIIKISNSKESTKGQNADF